MHGRVKYCRAMFAEVNEINTGFHLLEVCHCNLGVDNIMALHQAVCSPSCNEHSINGGGSGDPHSGHEEAEVGDGSVWLHSSTMRKIQNY